MNLKSTLPAHLSKCHCPEKVVEKVEGFYTTVAKSFRMKSRAFCGNQRMDPRVDAGLLHLMECARQVAQHSYAPYSNFRVGAALELTNGEIVTGTNVENVSLGLTICAERAALVQAVSRFGPEIRVAAAAVVNLNQAASPPCGACRQMMAEFILPEAPVAWPAADGMRTLPFSELLPLAFEMKLK